ncbi:MAG TPA: hypothetical protein VND66_07490 [Acidobacteriaceae bacterium]|nr:hypothetical protein [Terriglobia bacterium]HVC90447.1 hypothetical protein [Acidobacteriaceae bacterium]
MKLVVEVSRGSLIEHEVGTIERTEEIPPATVGLTITDGKALLSSLQKQIVTAQVQHHGASIQSCRDAEVHSAQRAITSPPFVLYTVTLACVPGD